MEAGRAVVAIAPTMSAVEELQKVGFADAVTVYSIPESAARRIHTRLLNVA
jgi:hypothetical protein